MKYEVKLVLSANADLTILKEVFNYLCNFDAVSSLKGLNFDAVSSIKGLRTAYTEDEKRLFCWGCTSSKAHLLHVSEKDKSFTFSLEGGSGNLIIEKISNTFRGVVFSMSYRSEDKTESGLLSYINGKVSHSSTDLQVINKSFKNLEPIVFDNKYYILICL